ncbi:MAG: PUA domain-containing protein [Promethearchaeia archaeon]
MNIKQRHFIKKSTIRDLKEDVEKHYNEDFVKNVFPDDAKVEWIKTEEDDELYAINNELRLWKSKEGYIPVLTLLLDNRVGLKSVHVDDGAIKFVTNGADIMKPGITRIDDKIEKGDIIRIAAEKEDRTLAVGKALYNAKEMRKQKKGKVIKNLHTINDNVWEFEKEFH